MTKLCQIPKDKQLIAISDGILSVYRLIEQYTGCPISSDFSKFITISKNELIDYLTSHPEQIDKHILKENDVQKNHDLPVLIFEGGKWIYCWMDHGKRSNETYFDSVIDAAASYLMAYFDR